MANKFSACTDAELRLHAENYENAWMAGVVDDDMYPTWYDDCLAIQEEGEKRGLYFYFELFDSYDIGEPDWDEQDKELLAEYEAYKHIGNPDNWY